MPAVFLNLPPYIVEVGPSPGVYFSREDYEIRVEEFLKLPLDAPGSSPGSPQERETQL